LLQELSADLSYALSNIDRDKISKISEQALRESEDRYRDLVENSLDIICSHDMDGKILSLNKRGAQLLDYAHDDLLKMNIRDILIPDVRSGFDNYLSEIRLNGSARGIMAVQTAAGKKRVWEYYNTLRTDGVSTPIVRGTAQDVTERRRAEEQARITEARLRNIIEHSTNLFYSHTTDQVLTYVSPQSRHFLDCEPEEAMIRWTEFVTDNPANQIGITAAQKAIDTAQRQPPYELELKTKHGRIIWVEVFEAPVVSNGRTVAIVGSLNDITDRKKAEAALKSNEELFRRLFQESTDPILILDDRGFTDCNQAAISILDYSSKDEFLNKKPWELSPTKQPDGRLSSEKAEAMIKKALEQGHNRFEWMHSKSDGTEFPVEVMLTSVILDGRQSYYTVWRDISERKIAEQKLLLQSSALNAAASGIVITDAKGTIEWVNLAFSSLTGYAPEELIGKNPRDIVKSGMHDQAFYKNMWNTILAGNVWRGEIINRRKDGSLYTEDQTITPLKDQMGNITHFIGIKTDVSQRKKIEEALRESNERFKLISRATNDAVWDWNIVNNDLWWNDRFYSLLGFNPSETKPTIEKWSSTIHPKDKENVLNHLYEAINGISLGWSEDFRIQLADRSYGYVYNRAYIQRDENGKALRMIGSMTDMTIFKKSEQQLIKSENRLRAIVDTEPECVKTLASDGTVLSMNAAGLRMIEADSADEVVGKSVYGLIDTKDQEAFKQLLQNVFNGQTGSLQFQIIGLKGNRRSLDTHVVPLRDEDGNITSLLGVTRDITDRQKADENRKENEAKLKVILESTTDGILAIDPNGVVFMANPRFFELWKIPESIRNSRNDKDLIDFVLEQLVDPEAFLAKVKMLYASNDNSMDTLEFKDGRIFERLSAPLLSGTTSLGRLWSFRDITDRKQSEEALRESEEKYKSFFDDDLTGDFISTPEGKLLACNPAFAKMFGYDTVEETLQIDVHSLYSDKKARENMLVRLKREKRLEYFSSELIRKDGKKIYVIENMIGTFDKSGKLTEIKGYLFDDTRRRSLETQLIQAQKMESLGTLAGGIAHDFNNILAIIMGHTSLIQRKAEGNTHVVQNAETITKATQRGAGLVKQLLTFARKTEIVLESILIQDTVNEITKFIDQTFPKTIVVHSDCAPNLPPILADATQIHQVLLNLCINARDAMPHGGTLTISAQRITKLHAHDRNTKTQAVEFVHLKVSDTGVGIEENVKNHIFEPFFTTKGRDRGTGLGLATVYGIIESHRGFIDVESEVGKGSTFNLYFPVQQSFIQHEVDTALVSEIAGGKETVLIVDDEESMRYYLKSILSEKGYHVLSASDGQEALDEFKKHADDIGLVLTDLGLPKISGEEFLETIFKINPAVKAIVASGYFESKMKVMLVKLGVKEFVQKPYAPDEILQKVREVIDLP
ncbi:PAS domain S-box protein, partial [bacterium]|nr:PAS domain S-box protein [bacterium]